MLNSIIHNPEMERYLVSYETGETLFFEGDDSQDIYVLVSGRIDILKGTKKIAEITREGVVFGEMSFLPGEKRTATVKAMTDVKAIRIPKENVEPFLMEFPEVVQWWQNTWRSVLVTPVRPCSGFGNCVISFPMRS